MPDHKDQRNHYTRPVDSLTLAQCAPLLRLAIHEDAPEGDPTSDTLFSADESRSAIVVAREPGVLCGTPLVIFLCDLAASEFGTAQLRVEPLKNEGERFSAGQQLMQIEGPLPTLLRLERPILNLLQYLSGISTTVAEAVALAGADIDILDTRKSVPGMRLPVKYAVWCGGGTNHRIHLSEMAMVKDNHIAAAGSITAAVEKIRRAQPGLPLEVEVDTIEQLRELLPLDIDVVLLDNMGFDELEQAVATIRQLPQSEQPRIEVSGGWKPRDLSRLKPLAPIGVSMGYLTHTSRFLDLSLEM